MIIPADRCRLPAVRAVLGAVLLSGLLCTGIVSASPGQYLATRVTLPPNASGAPYVEMSRVACWAPGSCVALGQYTANDGTARPLLLTEVGGSWTAVEAPLPAAANAAENNVGFSSLWCSNTGSCLATGTYRDGPGASPGQRPFVLSNHGGHWRSADVPLPADANTATTFGALDAVTCDPVGLCAATGTYLDSSGNYPAVVLVTTGDEWIASRAPLPSNAYPSQAFVTSIACPVAGRCHAVGTYSARYDIGSAIYVDQHALLLDYNAGSWSAVEATLPDASPAQPSASMGPISCSTSMCLTFANYYGPTSNRQDHRAAILTLSGGAWSSTSTPLPTNAGTGAIPSLSSSACDRSGFCVVTGSYRTASSSNGFLLSGIGGTWAAVDAPLPPGSAVGTSSFAADVSCPASGVCTAIGLTHSVTGRSMPVIFRLDAGSWSAQEALPPSGTQPPFGLSLSGLACGDIHACTIVGQYGYMTSDGLIETEEAGDPPAEIPEVPAPAVVVVTGLGTVLGTTAMTRRRRRRSAASALVIP